MRGSDYYYDYVKHHNMMLLSINNNFLVAQSIFFASYFVFISSIETDLGAKIIVLFLLASIIDLIWLLVNAKLIYTSLGHAKRKLCEKNEESYLKEYAENSSERNHWPRNNVLLGIFLPFVFLVSWVALFMFYLAGK